MSTKNHKICGNYSSAEKIRIIIEGILVEKNGLLKTYSRSPLFG